MFILQRPSKIKSSRKQINIKGIKDDVLILPNNQYRVIASASSVNLELRSEAEQDILIENYQNFLNSLSSPIQILFRIRELDFDKYIDSFKDKLTKETNTRYKKQIRNYCTFVSNLVSNNKILTRNFYLVIPFNAENKTQAELVEENLKLNFEIVEKGLARVGIHIKRLSNLEILELFYSFYSPEQTKLQPVTAETISLLKREYI